MKLTSPFRGPLTFLLAASLFTLGFMLSVESCHNKLTVITNPSFNPNVYIPPCHPGNFAGDSLVWGDWNILFKDSSTPAGRQAFLTAFEDSMCALVSQKYHGPVHIYQHACPCGPSIVNVQVVIDESGGSVVGTPPTGPPPGLSGGSVAFFAQNIRVQIPEVNQGIYADTGHKFLVPIKKPGKTILAIIDTGLDTLIYNNTTKNFLSWLWHDPFGTTQFNFLGGSAPNSLRDNGLSRHGTIVTAIALDMFADTTVVPRLMVLRALDDSGHGTIFSVSCAISYAICNHASVINASFGYYGAPDPILLKCISNSGAAGIPVVAAAGNVDPPHSGDFCANTGLPDYLGQNHLFYPACFSDTMGFQNMISVANVSQTSGSRVPSGPCFYQNYSPTYVSTGVMNKNSDDCCQYNHIPFVDHTMAKAEGSSFATPVVSGYFARSMEAGGTSAGTIFSGTNWLQNHTQPPSTALMSCCTVGGKYLIYGGQF